MRFRAAKSEAPEVSMSPLIDCVFLLLIFFLATSMIKKFERQIPVSLADPSAAVALEAEKDTSLMGIDKAGTLYTEVGVNWDGVLRFKPVADPAAALKALAASRGVKRPIELVIERDTPFQIVINVLDLFQLQGFEHVRSRSRVRALSR